MKRAVDCQAITLVICCHFSFGEISLNIGNIIMIKAEGILQYSTANSPQTICLLMTDRRGSNYTEHFKERLNVCQRALH